MTARDGKVDPQLIPHDELGPEGVAHWFATEINDLAKDIGHDNREVGWWDDPRRKGESIALMHSELSEALEAVRKGLADDHLPQFDGETVELADCIIRILDYASYYELPIGEALVSKLAYNQQRADHKRENRALVGGKKF